MHHTFAFELFYLSTAVCVCRLLCQSIVSVYRATGQHSHRGIIETISNGRTYAMKGDVSPIIIIRKRIARLASVITFWC